MGTKFPSQEEFEKYLNDHIHNRNGWEEESPLRDFSNTQTRKHANTEGKATMNHEAMDKKVSQVKGNAMSAMDTTKNVLIQLQKGQAVITTVKSALKKAPGLPDGMRQVLDTPYGDLVVGLILHTVAPVFTSNPIVLSAVKAANTAGAAHLSGQLTFIQDAIETAIMGVPGLDDLSKASVLEEDEV